MVADWAQERRRRMTDLVKSPDNGDTLAPLPLPSGTIADQVQDLELAYKFAQAMCNTEMVAQAFRGKPEAGAAAIMYGAELGMKPLQALQNIHLINGKPGIEARTMQALLQRQGCRFTVEDNGANGVTVTGTRPNGETRTSTWTMEDARQAGYTRNKLYEKTPGTMLFAKAMGEVCRRLAPDALLGIAYTTEELSLGFGDDTPPQKVKAEAVRPQQPTNSSPQKQALQAAVFGNAPAQQPADDGQQELQALISDLVGSGPFELQQYSEDINAHVAKYPQHREQLVKAWETVAAEAN